MTMPSAADTTLLWSPQTRARVLPRRSHGLREPLPDGAEAHAIIRALYTRRRNLAVLGVGHATPEHAALQQKALAYLDDGGPFTAIVAAASAMLLEDELEEPSAALAEALLDAWLADGGPALTVLACVATHAFRGRRNRDDKAIVLDRYVSIKHREDSETVELRWTALRLRLATMPDDAYAAAREAADQVRAKASLRLALRLAYAFPDETDWSLELARTVLAIDDLAPLPLLLQSLTDRPRVEEIVGRFHGGAFELAPMAFDIADALQQGAAPSLLAIADTAFDLHYGFDTERRDAYAALAVVPTPEVAAWLVAHLDDKLVRPSATAFFKRVPHLAIPALAPLVAATKKGGEHASALLGSVVRASPEESRAAAAGLEGPAAKLVLDLLVKSVVANEADPSELPAVLASGPAKKARKKKLPDWFVPSALPRPRLASTKHALPESALQHVGEMLAMSVPGKPHEGLALVREACDPESLGQFAWAVFEAWSLAGHPMNEKWGFFAIGHFGRDEHAHRLAALIRVWPSDGAFPRAVVGLHVLATMKTDVAFMLLHGIAEKVKSRPLQNKAQDLMESVAESLGLGTEELADRLVPALGLDDDGSRVLDFGSRTFRVGFDEHLRPFVHDADGARLAELPKPAKSDDEALAAAATSEWKALKKAAKAAATAQIARLQNAMIARHRWQADAFATYLVRHPLVTHLVRRLVFGAYDASGALIGTFRVAEDATYAGAQDELFVLPEGARVGVVHPLEIDVSAVAAWGQRLSEYEILQPFAQLGRDTPRDVTLADLDRFAPVGSLKLLALERRGWRRGRPGDGGIIWELEKDAGSLHVSISLEPGIYAGDPTMNPTQTPQGLEFEQEAGGAPDPIFLAEVAADLRAVGALTSPP